MIEKAKKKKKKSGVLITHPLGHCLGPFHCHFPHTAPSPAFHCAALLSTDDSPTWRVCKVFILPGIFSSFHGRHSVNICYLPKKNASMHEKKVCTGKWIQIPRVWKLPLEMQRICTQGTVCPDHDPSQGSASHMFVYVSHFLFWKHTGWMM